MQQGLNLQRSEWNPCAAPRQPETMNASNECEMGGVDGQSQKGEYGLASQADNERLIQAMASVRPDAGAWTQRDIDGLLADPARFERCLRALLVNLAPACPVVMTSELSLPIDNRSLDQLLYELHFERKVHPESFSDQPMSIVVPGYWISFTSPVAVQALAGADGILESFGFWPATLRETLAALLHNTALRQWGDVIVCGSVARREPDYFPYLKRLAATMALERRDGQQVLQPNQHFVLAFAKDK